MNPSSAQRSISQPTGAGRAPSAPGAPDPLELLTPDDLCTLFKVRRSWLYDAVESGELPVLRLGRQLRFRRRDVAQYLDGLAAAQV
jgi:excisionase family DNA binding protein